MLNICSSINYKSRQEIMTFLFPGHGLVRLLLNCPTLWASQKLSPTKGFFPLERSGVGLQKCRLIFHMTLSAARHCGDALFLPHSFSTYCNTLGALAHVVNLSTVWAQHLPPPYPQRQTDTQKRDSYADGKQRAATTKRRAVRKA